MKNTVIRQGDVLLVKVSEIPSDAKPAKRDKGRLILAYGEITGHSHSIEDKAARGFLTGDALYLSLEKETKAWHEDHNPKSKNAPLLIPPGKYRVIGQMEYRRQELVRNKD